MKITRTVVTNIYTAHFDGGITEEIKGRYSYAGAKKLLQELHPDDLINTIEITQESTKYGMELEEFLKHAAVIDNIQK